MAYRTTLRLLVVLCLPLSVQAQSPEQSKTVQEFVRVHAPRIVLTHVRMIEGTGKPAIKDQNVVIEDGRIAATFGHGDHPEWSGTVLSWELSPQNGGTTLRFTQSGWKEISEAVQR